MRPDLKASDRRRRVNASRGVARERELSSAAQSLKRRDS